jgi:hypothetical protein
MVKGKRRKGQIIDWRYQRGNQKPSIEGQTIQWFSFDHCMVCPSIDGFWLPLWYLQTINCPFLLFPLTIVWSVLRSTVSDYPFDIFKLLTFLFSFFLWPVCGLSFDRRFLITTLLSSSFLKVERNIMWMHVPLTNTFL